jgi:hypothetical protein
VPTIPNFKYNSKGTLTIRTKIESGSLRLQKSRYPPAALPLPTPNHDLPPIPSLSALSPPATFPVGSHFVAPSATLRSSCNPLQPLAPRAAWSFSALPAGPCDHPLPSALARQNLHSPRFFHLSIPSHSGAASANRRCIALSAIEITRVKIGLSDDERIKTDATITIDHFFVIQGLDSPTVPKMAIFFLCREKRGLTAHT